jgi:hypothetical protein
MSKAISSRTHAAKVAISNRHMSPDQIRAGKCASTKAHNATIKAARVADAQERSEAWQALSHADQIRVLDSRLGDGVGAKKQRAKIAAAIAEKKKSSTVEKKSIVKKKKGKKK